MNLYQKHALILGSSSGLGFASAKKLATHGCNIIAVYRERAATEKELLAQFQDWEKEFGIKVYAFNKNALAIQEIQEIIAFITSSSIAIDIIIHSIAKGNLKNLKDDDSLSLDDIQITMHAMASNWWEWIQLLMKEKAFEKSVANIAFTSEGNTKYIPNYTAVSMAKVGLETLARYMAVELAEKGIRTNIIQSGYVKTPSSLRIPNADKLMDWTAKRNPMNRLTTADDVANAVYLLCLSEAAFINGTVLKVDGGESLK